MSPHPNPKAGIYLNDYLPAFSEKDQRARQIAENISSEFYNYGNLLQGRDEGKKEIPQGSFLSPEDKTKLDQWFLGKEAYQRRVERFGGNPSEQQKDEYRKKFIPSYFRALAGEGYKAEGDKPWETKVGPRQRLQDQAREQITKVIETPQKEMETAIFRRGLETLVTEMKMIGWRRAVQNLLAEGADLDIATEQVKLYNQLEIPRLKQELERARESGDIKWISFKELQIAKKIQRAVTSFPYASGEETDYESNNPADMVKNQYVNCVGSSILGGGLLDEVGIKYLHADLLKHSATVLLTSDEKAYWQDFTPPGGSFFNYHEIKPEMIEEGEFPVLFNFPNRGIQIQFQMGFERFRINLSNPEKGLQSHLLINTAKFLGEIGRKRREAEAYKAAIRLDLIHAIPYHGLGDALDELGRKSEAIDAYRQAINLDSRYVYAYNNLGVLLQRLGRKSEAIELYRQAINVDPDYPLPYSNLGLVLSGLGRKSEAIEAYQKFLSKWNGDTNTANSVRWEIEKLEKEL